MSQVTRLVKLGELSHAVRVISSGRLAPGTSATLSELRDPDLRPKDPVDPYPENLHSFQPASMVELDRVLFGDVLRQTRPGLSAALGRQVRILQNMHEMRNCLRGFMQCC